MILSPLAPNVMSFVDASNSPLTGGQVTVYKAGTTEPVTTYTDASGATANPNTVVLDSFGKAPIFVGMETVDLAVADALGNPICTLTKVQNALGASGVYDRVFNVLKYGALGNGTQDASDTNAVAAARAELAAAGGGVLYFPTGSYWLTAEQDFISSAQAHNVIIRGDGMASTYISFAGAPAGSHGFTFNAGGEFGIEDLTIFTAKGHGLWIGKGSTPGVAPFASMFYVRNVKIDYCVGDGIHLTNAFMGTIADCWSLFNSGKGICFDGYHTSMHVSRTWGMGNAGDNWTLNGLSYSSFIACGSDSSTAGHGWAISNVAGVSLINCGSEGNYLDAFSLVTSNGSAAGLPAQAQDIHGLTFDNCFAIGNSAAGTGLYASFIAARTANNRPMDFRVLGGVASPNGASDVAFVLNAAAGPINALQDGFRYDGFTAPDAAGGAVTRVNRSVAGCCCTVNLAAPFPVPAGANTTISWSATPVANDLQASVTSSGVVIPAGVNKVRVSANVAFTGNTVGVRQVSIQKNGTYVAGLPQETLNATCAGGMFMGCYSGAIAVAPGDVLSVVVYQNSGTTLPILNNSASWFSVEAIS